MTSRPYHGPHPLARFTYHFDQVRVVWPSVSRYFHFQESYTLSVWSLVLCTHYRTGTVSLLRFGKRYAYTSKIFRTNFQKIQKFQSFRIQNSNKIDIFNKGRSKKKGFIQKATYDQGGRLLSLRMSMVNFIPGRSTEPSQKCTHSLTSKERSKGYVRIQKCKIMGLETRFFRIQCVL